MTAQEHLAGFAAHDCGCPGQPIGVVGSSGHSSGPHLHLESHTARPAVEPTALFRARGVDLGAS